MLFTLILWPWAGVPSVDVKGKRFIGCSRMITCICVQPSTGVMHISKAYEYARQTFIVWRWLCFFVLE